MRRTIATVAFMLALTWVCRAEPAPAPPTDYTLSKADLVSVAVFGEPDFSRRARVDSKGMIYLPLAGGVEVGGKTVGQARALIESKLAGYLVKPQVSLLIEEYGVRQVFVVGEVQKPGPYALPIESTVTVLEAITMAGGFTPVASPGRTRVLRKINGRSVSYSVDVKDITSRGQKEKDVALQPDDVVYVPQALF